MALLEECVLGDMYVCVGAGSFLVKLDMTCILFILNVMDAMNLMGLIDEMRNLIREQSCSFVKEIFDGECESKKDVEPTKKVSELDLTGLLFR